MEKTILKKFFLWLMCLSIMTTMGCWNYKDLTQRSFAVAIGLDKTNDNQIELTLQIIKPSVIKSSQQNGGGGGGKGEPVWTITSTGETTFEALRNTLTTINRKVFLTQIQLIIIGEELAKDGIGDGLDFWERDQESNVKADVLIAKGMTAKEILSVKSELEDIPAMHIVEILKNNYALAKIRRVNFFNLLEAIQCPGHALLIGTIEAKGKKQVANVKDLKVEGAAVFRKDKLIGWLNSMETRGFLFADNKVQSGIINVSNPMDSSKKLAIEITRSTGKIDVKFTDEKPKFLIDIKARGNIGEQQGQGDLTRPEMIKKLENELERVTKNEIKRTMELAQKKYKTDFFAFCHYAHKNTEYWNRVKNKWDGEFSSIPVEINVEFEIRRSGYVKKPAEFR